MNNLLVSTEGVSELRVRLQYRKLENVLIQSGIIDDASIRKSHYVAYNAEHCRDLCLAAYGEDCGVFRYVTIYEDHKN